METVYNNVRPQSTLQIWLISLQNQKRLINAGLYLEFTYVDTQGNYENWESRLKDTMDIEEIPERKFLKVSRK